MKPCAIVCLRNLTQETVLEIADLLEEYHPKGARVLRDQSSEAGTNYAVRISSSGVASHAELDWYEGSPEYRKCILFN